MIDTRELSIAQEKITRGKVVQEQNRERIETIIRQIEKYESMITDTQKERMRERGLFIESILNSDKDKLRTDPAYVQSFLQKCDDFTKKFIEIISEVL